MLIYVYTLLNFAEIYGIKLMIYIKSIFSTRKICRLIE